MATIQPSRLVKKIASKKQVPISQICVICLDVIDVMAFKNTGVCCEAHRKERDNDLLPFRGGTLAP